MVDSYFFLLFKAVSVAFHVVLLVSNLLFSSLLFGSMAKPCKYGIVYLLCSLLPISTIVPTYAYIILLTFTVFLSV